MKRIVIGILSVIVLMFLLSTSVFKTSSLNAINRDVLNGHDIKFEFDIPKDSNFKSYSSIRSDLSLIDNNTIISINTSEELYLFSKDLSYKSNLPLVDKKLLASSNYTLGANIDYKEMKSKRFIPIGYYSSSENYIYFSGNFDARGFEIRDLYFVSIDDLIDSHQGYLKPNSEYLAMFNYNYGVIQNIGLINPIIELQGEHEGINKIANLVGLNSGAVRNVYVEDNRSLEESGMKALSLSGSNLKTAAGIVHTNSESSGVVFENSYYTGKLIVNKNYSKGFITEPLIIESLGDSVIDKLVYNSSEYVLNTKGSNGETITINEPVHGTGVSESELLSGTNQLNDDWGYYKDDSFPKRNKLEYKNGYFIINDIVDYLTFTKLIGYKSKYNNVKYTKHEYRLANSIDYNDIAPNTNLTPKVSFEGVLSGRKSNAKYANYELTNFDLSEGVVLHGKHYFGLFSILKGTVRNINVNNAKVIIDNDLLANSKNEFNISTVAGYLDGGIIKEVIVNSIIDISESLIQEGIIGGIVASGHGQIIDVGFQGSITATISTFYSNRQVERYVGGIIGKSDSLSLVIYNALNESVMKGWYTLDVSTTPEIKSYIGGVIGYINNATKDSNNIGLVSSTNTIDAYTLTKGDVFYLGGVIGYSTGEDYQNNQFQGNWENKGTLNSNVTVSSSKYYTAGVVNSFHEKSVSSNKIYSSSTLSKESLDSYVSSLINHLGTGELIVNDAISNGSVSVFTSYINGDKGSYGSAINVNTKVRLNYVGVNTNLIVLLEVLYYKETSISGVTNSINGSFKNVSFNGNVDINVESLNGELYYAGITNTLSYGNVIENSSNEGTININVHNEKDSMSHLYVAGLVNFNYGGYLNLEEESNNRNEVVGINNSFNSSDINILADQKTNTLIGGLVTFNGGLTDVFGLITATGGTIKDSINFGNITAINNDSNVANMPVVSLTETQSYTNGIIIGGIAATNGSAYSKILDVVNDGNLKAISYRVTRVGGILGFASYKETVYSKINDVNSKFLVEDLNDEASLISNSVISNAINYGIIHALSLTNGRYSQTNVILAPLSSYPEAIRKYLGTSKMNTKGSSGQAINVYSSAGGILGFGNLVILRTINHGKISSTDNAGGIIGTLTFSGIDNTVKEELVFNTLINYGKIRAINSEFISSIIDKDGEVTESNYYQGRDFIFPANPLNRIEILPEDKRGFGGIIGKVQKSEYVVSGSTLNFNNFINFDSNIDLIGRIDQSLNFEETMNKYQFEDLYIYSSNLEDTTQTVFTGYTYEQKVFDRFVASQYFLTATKEAHPTNKKYSRVKFYMHRSYSHGGVAFFNEFTQVRVGANGTIQNYKFQKEERIDTPDNSIAGMTFYSNWTTNDLTSYLANNEYKNGATYFYFKDILHEETISTLNFVLKVSETNTNLPYNVDFAYSSYFRFTNNTTILENGESIKSFINYAVYGRVALRFSPDRRNGMYVLNSSDTTKKEFLPRNFNISKFGMINKDSPYIDDYENIKGDLLDELSEEVISKYMYTHQVRINNESLILIDNDDGLMNDISSDTDMDLTNPIIDNGNTSSYYKQIRFKVDKSWFGTNRSFQYELENIKVPYGAILARNITAADNKQEFRLEMKRQIALGRTVATGKYAPVINITIPANIPSQIGNYGDIYSYSEISLDADYNVDVPSYKTRYVIKLDLIDLANNEPTLEEVANEYKDNTNELDWKPFAEDEVYNLEDLMFAMRFKETKGVYPANFKFSKYTNVYYENGTESNSDTILVDGKYLGLVDFKDEVLNHSFKVLFSEKLKSGLYYIRTSMGLSNSYIEVKVRIVNNSNVLVNDALVNTGTYYNNNVGNYAFGYNLYEEIVNGGSDNFKKKINTDIEPYLFNYSYEIPFFERFQLSNFFEIGKIEAIENSLDSVSILITELVEDGNIPRVLYLTYYEEDLEVIKYADDVRFDGDIIVNSSYEDIIIRYELLLNEVVIDDVMNNINNIITPSDNIKIEVRNNKVYFIFNNVSQLKVPEYNILISVSNNNEIKNVINDRVKFIRTVDAYLKDIKFDEGALEYIYPEIFESDNKGTIIKDSSYDMGVYYDGIDYDLSDKNNVKYFRIDGFVNGGYLNNYRPDFLRFLAPNTNVQRRIYNNGVGMWGEAVNNESSEDKKDMLNANFNVEQSTGKVPTDGSRPLVQYVVTSLGTTTTTSIYYFISVTDIKNVLDLNFNFLYKNKEGITSPLIENNRLKDLPIGVHATNYLTDTPIGTNNIEDVTRFPKFNEILGVKSKAGFNYIASLNNTSRIANNLNGYYHFLVNTPKGYNYYIEYSNQTLESFTVNDVSRDGYYYYSNKTIRHRSRTFTIVIFEENNSWGLTDKN